MFIFQKILIQFLVPPGIIILLMIVSGLCLSFRKNRKAGLLILFFASLLWLVSTPLFSGFLMEGLEQRYEIPDNPDGDVIILLGGGSHLKSPDMTGTGAPSGDTLGRLVTAVRLQKVLGIPVIISSGDVFKHMPSEAPIIKRYLLDLGVSESRVIVENKSKNTEENAKYTKFLIDKRGFKKPILVTSAYHMRRSVMLFKKVGIDVLPFPSNFKTSKIKEIHWDSYLPSSSQNTAIAITEYIGLLFYSLT